MLRNTAVLSRLCAGLVIATTIACVDQGLPLGPAGDASGVSDATFVRLDGQRTRVTGRATLVVRNLSGPTPGGVVVQSEAGSYDAIIESNGTGVAHVSLAGSDMELDFQQATHGKSIGKVKEHDFASARDGASRTVRLTRPSADVDVAEFIRNGERTGFSTREWKNSAKGRRLHRQTTTFYSQGAPVASITLTLDDGNESEIGDGSSSIRVAGIETFADRPAFQYVEGPCASLIRSMEDALVNYEAAALAMIGCFAGPWVCGGLSITAAAMAFRLEMSINRAESCLAAY
jgi:hypothetical protein